MKRLSNDFVSLLHRPVASTGWTHRPLPRSRSVPLFDGGRLNTIFWWRFNGYLRRWLAVFFRNRLDALGGGRLGALDNNVRFGASHRRTALLRVGTTAHACADVRGRGVCALEDAVRIEQKHGRRRVRVGAANQRPDERNIAFGVGAR